MSSIQSFPGQVIKCRAAVAYAVNEPLVVEEINVAPPKAGEVRIKIYSSGICHTDWVSMIGDYGEIFPLIFGHEGSGVVESVGEGVTSVAPGDHVIPSYMAQCDKCDNCKNPDNNFCEKTKFTSSIQPGVLEDGTTRFSTLDGKPIYQFLNVGSFSEYTVVSEVFVVKINPAADLEKVCLLGCGISTGYGNVFNVAKVKPESAVGVWGLGGIGLAIVMSARLAGAKHIIGIDTNPDKFALAKKLGATDCVNPKDLDFDADKLQKCLTEEKCPGGLDYTFECIGNPKTMQASLQALRIGSGVNCLVGVVKEGTMWPIDPLHLILGITIKGSCFGGLRSKTDLPGIVDKYVNGEITLDEFISHRFKLEQINEAFDLLKQGKCLRSVIVF